MRCMELLGNDWRNRGKRCPNEVTHEVFYKGLWLAVCDEHLHIYAECPTRKITAS